MTKLKCIVSISLFLFAVNSANAQKNVNRILDYYESGAYHLAIKKINNLKVKRQSKSSIQLVLADCYWQIGEKERSTEIYKHVAVAIGIPNTFKEKYERAIFEKSVFTSLALNSIPTEYFKMPSVRPVSKGNIIQPAFPTRKSVDKLELISQKAFVKATINKPKLVEINTSIARVNESFNTPLASPLLIQTRRINEKRASFTLLVNSQGD